MEAILRLRGFCGLWLKDSGIASSLMRPEGECEGLSGTGPLWEGLAYMPAAGSMLVLLVVSGCVSKCYIIIKLGNISKCFETIKLF